VLVLGRDTSATEFVGDARLPAGRAGIRGLAFLSGDAFLSGFRSCVFYFRDVTPKIGCVCVSSRPHPAIRPTLRRRLAEGGALVLGRNVAATEFREMLTLKIIRHHFRSNVQYWECAALRRQRIFLGGGRSLLRLRSFGKC